MLAKMWNKLKHWLGENSGIYGRLSYRLRREDADGGDE